MKKSVSRFVTLLILCSFLFTLPKINIVKASETIYIKADGSIEGTDKIQRDGNVYTFTDNIYDPIVVKRDNIVVDGAGYILQGTGASESRGIDLSQRSDVTISNMRIRYFDDGILLGKSSNKIVDNYLTNNSDGICLESSSENSIISGNNITNNWSGIRNRGSNNIISTNSITNNKNYGIYFDYSSDNSIVGNNITNNGRGGIYFLTSSNNIVSHNNFINNTKHVKDANSDAPWLIPSSVNIWDDSREGNYWSDYEDRYPDATELDSSGIWDTPYIIYENNRDNHPLMTYWIPSPTISIVSPENKMYKVNHVSLTFILSEPTSWIAYSLDGQSIVTIAGNTTLTGLSDGSHSLIVYAKDAAGNTEASEIICFSTKTQQWRPFLTWIVVEIAIVAVIVAALLVYFRKIKKTTEEIQ